MPAALTSRSRGRSSSMELSWPSANTGKNLAWHIRKISRFPMRRANVALCCRWRDRHDVYAAQQLVGGHLRLVLKIARSCHVHGLSWEDLIHFATYAIWRVRAVIEDISCKAAWPHGRSQESRRASRPTPIRHFV